MESKLSKRVLALEGRRCEIAGSFLEDEKNESWLPPNGDEKAMDEVARRQR